MTYQIDIAAIIAALKLRWNELHNYVMTFQDPDPAEYLRRRSQLLQLMASIDEEIIEQQRIVDDQNAAQVTVQGVTAQKVAELNAALNDLNKAIQQNEVWGNVISLATAALNAATTLRNAI